VRQCHCFFSLYNFPYIVAVMTDRSGLDRAAFNRKADLYGKKVEVREKISSDEFGNPIYGYITLTVEKAMTKPVKSREDVIEAGLLTLGDAGSRLIALLRKL